MDTSKIISDLRAERDRIDAAIRALETLNGRGSATKATREAKAAPAPKRRRRRMSAAARQRISQAAKARWAARKKAAGKQS